MYVILTYDAKEKRVNKCLKICRKYLIHVQKSVFEGSISEKNLNRLKQELKGILKPKEDSCSIYVMSSVKYCYKEVFGAAQKGKEIIEDNISE